MARSSRAFKTGSAVVALLAILGCGAATSHRPISSTRAADRASSSATHALDPVRRDFHQVVWIAQDEDCAGDAVTPTRAIELDVNAIWGPIMRRFGPNEPPRVLGVEPPRDADAIDCSASGLRGLQALKDCLAGADPTRGVTLIFVGHGRSIDRRAVAVASEVCLDGQFVRIEDLLGAVPNSVPWRFAIVVACYSATVDVRGARPTSVLSASPGLIGFDTRVGGKERAASAFAMAIADAMDDIVDTSCDGVISDQELHERVLAHVQRISTQDDAESSPLDRTTLPRPRLRRDASAALPLFSIKRSETCNTAQQRVDRIARAAAQHRGLIEGLAVQRRMLESQHSSVLPIAAVDFFVLANELAQRDCVAGRGRYWREPMSEERYAVLCRAAIAQGLEPLALPERATREDVRALGRYVSFSEVYWIALEGGWVHIDRMRDDRRIATRSIARAALAMPNRQQTIARSSSEETLRYTRQAPPRTAADQAAVCPQDEGQCFVVRAPEAPAPARPEQWR